VTEAQANRQKTKCVLAVIIVTIAMAGYLKHTQVVSGHASEWEVLVAVGMGVIAFVWLTALVVLDWSIEQIASRDLLKNSHW